MRLFTVQETKLIGKNTLLLTITPKRKRDAITFYPGQYAAIGFKRHGRPSPMRCFSIVSSPLHPEALQFAMRIQGNFTQAIAELKQGDTVFVHGPFGEFVIDERYDKNIVMMAGGIGVTPFMSMARYAADTNLQIPMTLLYSCSYPDDIPFMDELIELERRNPRFKVTFFITQGSVDKLQNVRRLSGRIDEDRLRQLTGGRYDGFTYFVCGPKQFTKSLNDTLLANNVPASRVITEEFTPSSSVESAAVEPRHSVTRWTYGLTGATLVLASAFFMVLDLARVVPKLQAQASAQSASQAQPVVQASNTPATSSNSAANTSNSSSYSTPTYTQTYQQPMTTVS